MVVVKYCPQRLATLALLVFIAAAAFPAAPTSPSPAAAAQGGADQRPGTLDMIVLLDKSLSMRPFFDKAKAYAAGDLIGAILVPGDRLIVEVVYGKVERLITATIASEEDKAKAIRAIRAVEADGRFTDLGSALDSAKRDLDELGQPERPKYVVLITDERQEAPKGSPYQAPDHKLVHPSLQYIKKQDLGPFRAITVGLQVGQKVNAAATTVMQLLMDPPKRSVEGSNLGPATGSAASPGSAAGAGGGATKAERALPSWLLYGAAGVLGLCLVGVVGALIVAGRRRKREEGETGKASESR